MNMVQTGVTEKLLALLSKNNTSNGDIRLQHALLSALRNLCIAPQNKPLIIKQVRYIDIQIFKLKRYMLNFLLIEQDT